MNTISANQFEQKVSSVFEHCITRIADELEKNFDPLKKNMISLFRLFSSSVKTRNSWISSINKPKNRKDQNSNSPAKSTVKKNEKPIDLDKVLSFDIPKKKGAEYQHPIKPEHMKSGLLLKR